MEFLAIKEKLVLQFGEALVVEVIEGAQLIEQVGFFLRDTELMYFDSLSCLSALDSGVEKNTFEVLYHLYSIPYHHSLVLKVFTSRTESSVPSLCAVWKTANWHEREAYDMFGISFSNHPDLRRILLPADWEGFPLRKDYSEQAYYHGIKVTY